MSDLNGHTPPQPPPIGVQLGLGPAWQPQGFGWDWQKGMGPKGTMHILRIHTAFGSIGLALDDEGLAAFVRIAQEHKSGLSIAPTMPPQPPQP